MTLSIMLTLLFLIAFIEGFVFMWFMMDDIGDDVVVWHDIDELQEQCWNGLRKGD